ncbi:MAG: response regulator [Thauera sp.]|jgi:CheY-like chemotaxis protein|nr:response regulator [Thauera sp.]
MKLLVVDDDPMAGEMLAAILEDSGHQVVLSEDALDGSAQLDAHPDIALIISDMNMPLMSGIDFFRELRVQASPLPFVLLTGDDPAALLAEEPGLDACLMKDFDLENSLPALIAGLVSVPGTSSGHD